jgi:type IV pilus assembly protein PilA
MTVVVIVGILAALGVYGVRRYINAAKSSEARSMILNIKAAEEAYREETYQYLPTANALTGTSELYPHACLSIPPGKVKVAWEQNAGCNQAKAMRTLGVTSTSPVYYGYGVGVPAAGGSMPALPLTTAFNWGGNASPTGPAFAVVARGDVNGDGAFSTFVSSSFTDEVHVEAEDE